jgi:hypothetical protein
MHNSIRLLGVLALALASLALTLQSFGQEQKNDPRNHTNVHEPEVNNPRIPNEK